MRLHYLLPFGRGGTVNTAEEEDELIAKSVHYKGVRRAAPGKASGSANYSTFKICQVFRQKECIIIQSWNCVLHAVQGD